MKRTTPLKRTRLRPMSDRKATTRALRRTVVAMVIERDGFCQALRVWPHTCRGPLVGHEPLKRSAGGNELDPDAVLAVCQFVNGRVEDEPEWAREVGLSVHSWQDWSWSRDWQERRTA